MTKLRQRMTEELRLRNCSEETIRSHIESVGRLARYYHKGPDQMNAEVQVLPNPCFVGKASSFSPALTSH